jgi:hypothetical protein
MLHVVSNQCLFLCIHVSTSVERIIAEKLIGFWLTKIFLHCVQPKLSLPYIIQKKVKCEGHSYIKVLKISKNDFKYLSN